MIDTTVARDTVVLKLVQEAVGRLVLRLPLIGLTLLGRTIRILEDPAVPTCQTNGQLIKYNPAFLAPLPTDDVAFVILHEWLHIFGNDIYRGHGLIQDVWAYAIDMCVNKEALRLMKYKAVPADGIEPGAHVMLSDLTKEEVYRWLLDSLSLPKKERTPHQVAVCDAFERDSARGHSEEPAPQTPDFVDGLRQDLSNALTAMSRITDAASLEKIYGSVFMSRLGALLADTLPWDRILIGDLATALDRSTLSWRKPSLRYWPYLVLPSPTGYREKVLGILVDVSASMDQRHVDVAISAVSNAARRAKKSVVVVFDAQVREVHVTTQPQTILKSVRFLQGAHSHTSAMEAFQVISSYNATACVVFTDGMLEYPDVSPMHTAWVLTPDGSVPKWGRVYRMRDG